MMSAALPSYHLDEIVRELSPHCGGDEVRIAGDDFDSLVGRLASIRKMMVLIEREVGALRLAESARTGRVIVEDLATEQFQDLVDDPEGRVVRPDFGRKK